MNRGELQLLNNKKEKEGLIVINKEGYACKIIEYNNTDDIYVRILDDYETIIHNTWHNISRGMFHNPYSPTILNTGIIGNTKTYEHGYLKYSYKVWMDMITRCVDISEKFINYKDCYFCDEWIIYETFEKWYDKNYWECDDETMCLDKDILIKGKRLYSPNTCVVVPTNINLLFLKSNKSRGNLPIGVRTMGKKFQARCSIDNNAKVLGIFKTINEAFDCYKTFKESYIKQVANSYKSKYPNFPQKLYDAMYSYEVEITD